MFSRLSPPAYPASVGFPMPFLDRIPKGCSATVIAVHGDNASAARLYALGFLPGRTVTHRNTALFGDPNAYEVDSQKIALRASEARLVEVSLSLAQHNGRPASENPATANPAVP